MSNAEHKSFSTLIADIEDGRIHDELTDVVTKIVEELVDRQQNQGGKHKAKLSIELNFILEGRTIDITAAYKETLPKKARSRSTYFATDDFELTRNDPLQRSLPLQEVTTRTAVRTA